MAKATQKRSGTVKKVNGRTILTTEDGKVIRLMSPREKAKKAAYELQTGIKYTNLGQVKTDKNGNPIKLTQKDRTWRSGYLASNTDCAKAYKAKHKQAGAGNGKNATARAKQF